MINLSLKNIYAWPMGIRLLIISVVFVIVFTLGYMWDLSALRTVLSESKEKEQELKQQYDSILVKITNLQTIIAQYNQYKILLQQWQTRFIKRDVLPELLNEILKIGSTNQLYFNLFNPGEETAEGFYAKIPIHVIVVGNYHQLGNFFSQLANLKWIVVIGNFSITTETKNDMLGAKLAEQAAARNLLVADLNLEVYHLLDTPVPPKNDAKTSDESKPDAKAPEATEGGGHGK